MYFVYILKSEKNHSFYVGYSGDVEKRLVFHNDGKVKATKYRRPFRLVHTECYNAATEARKREYYIKRQKSRKFIENLIQSKVKY